MKRFVSIALLVMLFLVISMAQIAFAATESQEAVPTTYDTYVNAELRNDVTMNIGGRTYFQGKAMEEDGMQVKWLPNEGANGEAHFNIFDTEDIVKKNVLFYRGNGQFLGNGVWVKTFNADTTTEYILTTRNVWSPSWILKAKEYDGDAINLYPLPVKIGERLILLKAKTPSKYFAETGAVNPGVGENIYFAGSVNECRNLINLSKVHSYEDFNIFDTDKEYMRTNHNIDQSGQGSPMYTTDGLLAGVMVFDGINHVLSVKLSDIISFLD